MVVTEGSGYVEADEADLIAAKLRYGSYQYSQYSQAWLGLVGFYHCPWVFSWPGAIHQTEAAGNYGAAAALTMARVGA